MNMMITIFTVLLGRPAQQKTDRRRHTLIEDVKKAVNDCITIIFLINWYARKLIFEDDFECGDTYFYV